MSVPTLFLHLGNLPKLLIPYLYAPECLAFISRGGTLFPEKWHLHSPFFLRRTSGRSSAIQYAHFKIYDRCSRSRELACRTTPRPLCIIRCFKIYYEMCIVEQSELFAHIVTERCLDQQWRLYRACEPSMVITGHERGVPIVWISQCKILPDFPGDLVRIKMYISG